jgi:hypothetical protein
MNSGTWEAIARRQAWYLEVLQQKLAEWPRPRIDACTDLVMLGHVIKLAKRADRHEQLMVRHLGKALASLPAAERQSR